MPGFGRDDFPVGVALGYIAGKGPDIRHVGDFFGVAVDDRATAVACGRNQFGHEAHRDLRSRPVAQLGRRYGRTIDRDETSLGCFAAALALGNRRVEAVIDFTLQQNTELPAVATGESRHNHLVGGACTGNEMLGVKARIRSSDRIKPGRHA